MTNKRVVIIGAGGHGREVAEVLRGGAQERLSLVGFVDEALDLAHRTINSLPVLGGWSWFETADRNALAVICALGSSEIRKKLVGRAADMDLAFCNAISRSAYVSPDAKLGHGVMILPHAVVGPNCTIGDHAIINVGATVSHDSEVGSFGTINPGAHIAGNVSIGEGCCLGIGANVVHGVSIGAWSVIGGGAVVTDDLPGGVTAVGVPAKAIKTRGESR
jgi:UDP-perosamine 4-acetyltransferase